MTEITLEQLINIINNNLDYVLELGILQEPQLCRKPVHKFERAFVHRESFCMIYSEADDPEIIYLSHNLNNNPAELIREHKISRIISHANKISGGELFESYYNSCDGSSYENIRLLDSSDINSAVPEDSSDYIKIIFDDFIINKIWHDCGITGIFDNQDNFAGYLAYYKITENIRDISYIYIKSSFRGLGYAKKLLEYFKHINFQDNKISYYSYAADKASANLAESCGFIPCAKRYEQNILK